MARLNHVLFGQAKGKVGGMVLQRYEGMNIAREKPLTIKNPQSTKQTEQRAKFKLCSQFLAQFADIVKVRLSPISIYSRIQRGTAVSACIDVTTFNNNEANLAVTDALNAINEKNISAVATPAIATAGQNVTITIAMGLSGMYTICAYNTATGEFISKLTESWESDGTAKVVDLPIVPVGINPEYRIVALALETETEDGRAKLGNALAKQANTTVEVTRLIASGDVHPSNMVGSIHIPA